MDVPSTIESSKSYRPFSSNQKLVALKSLNTNKTPRISEWCFILRRIPKKQKVLVESRVEPAVVNGR